MSNNKLVHDILNIPSETRTLEFKRLGMSRNESVDKTLQSIVAMANTDGGIIIFGVDDPQKTRRKGLKRIFGIEENAELYDEIGQSMRRIYPPIPGVWPPKLFLADKNKNVAILTVPKTSDGFRCVENHVYIRQERGNRLLSPQEIVHFSYVKGFSRADKELVEVDFDILNTYYYDTWKRARNIIEFNIKTALEKTGLARKNSRGKILPTRAAVLLFADFPNNLMDTKCSIRVFQYEGNKETIKETLNIVGTPENIEGPIIKQINDAHKYVLKLLRSGISIPSGFITKYQIPERAIKEAITNAVIHRDYHTKKDIEIRIFENRVEIESPGLFPFNITPSNIGIERAYEYRNDLLVKNLREFPEPPNLDQNEGVRAMRQTMKASNLYPPIFWTYPNLQDSVRVILLNEEAASEWDKISNYLNKNKYITNAEARKILYIEDTVKTSKILNRLVKKGLLTKLVPRTGAKRNVRYRLPTADERNLFSQNESK